MLETAVVPKTFLEPSAVSFEKKISEEEISRSLRMLMGSVALVPIKRGEQVTYTKLVEPSMRTGLASQVTPGKRAMSVPVTETSGVAKLVKPGDRIDLIAIIDSGQGKEAKIAKTLFQDVMVLAVGRAITNNVARVVEADSFTGKDKARSLAEDFSFSSVTLEVDPTQAQSLALMLANGDAAMTLSLRNNDDSDRVAVQATSLYDVIGSDLARIPQRGPAGGKR